MNSSDRADLFLLPLDPQGVLRRAYEDFSRFVELDARRRAGAELVNGRLAGYSAEDQEILAMVFWTYMRNRLKGSANVEATTGRSEMAIFSCAPSRSPWTPRWPPRFSPS